MTDLPKCTRCLRNTAKNGDHYCGPCGDKYAAEYGRQERFEKLEKRIENAVSLWNLKDAVRELFAIVKEREE